MAKKRDLFNDILALLREVEPQYSKEAAEAVANFAVANPEFRELVKEQVQSERMTKAEAAVAREQGELLVRSGGLGGKKKVSSSVFDRQIGKELLKEKLAEQRETAAQRAAVNRLKDAGVIDRDAYSFESAQMRGPEATREFLEGQSQSGAAQLGKLRKRMDPGSKTRTLSQETFVDPYGERRVDIINQITNRPTDRVETFTLEEDEAGRLVARNPKEVVNTPSGRKKKSLATGFKKSPVYQHAIQFAKSQGRPLTQEDIDQLPRKTRKVLSRFTSPDIQVFENTLPDGKKTYGVIRRGFRGVDSGGPPITKTFSIKNGEVTQIQDYTGEKVIPSSATNYIKSKPGFQEVKRNSHTYKRAVVDAKLVRGADITVLKNPETGETLITGRARPGGFDVQSFTKSTGHDVGEGSAKKSVPDRGKARAVTVRGTGGETEQAATFKTRAKGGLSFGGGKYGAGVTGVEQLRRDVRAAGMEPAGPERDIDPETKERMGRGVTSRQPQEGIQLEPDEPIGGQSRTKSLRLPLRKGSATEPIREELAIKSEIKMGIVRRLRDNPKYKDNEVLLRKTAQKQVDDLVDKFGLTGAIDKELEEARRDIKRIVDSGASVPQRVVDRVYILENTREQLNIIPEDASGSPTRTSRQKASEERVRKRQAQLRGTPDDTGEMMKKLKGMGTGELMAHDTSRHPSRRRIPVIPATGPREVPPRLGQSLREEQLMDKVYRQLIELVGGDDIERSMELARKIVKRGSRSNPLLRVIGAIAR